MEMRSCLPFLIDMQKLKGVLGFLGFMAYKKTQVYIINGKRAVWIALHCMWIAPYRIRSQLMVLERGCNLLEIIPVGIGSGAILGSSSAVGNNCICMNFQLIQNLVSTSANIRNILVKIQS